MNEAGNWGRQFNSYCICVPSVTRYNTGLRPMVYKLFDHVVGSGLFRGNTITVTTTRFFPNQSNLHFVMTLSCSASTRAPKQNSMTLNTMMRQWEAEQTGLPRHSLLLLFRGFVKCRILLMGILHLIPAYAGLFESSILYTVPGIYICTRINRDPQADPEMCAQLQRITDYQKNGW